MLKLIDTRPGMNVAAPFFSMEEEHIRFEFTPSPHGGLERLWFHFALQRQEGGNIPPITRLVMKNVNTMLYVETGDFRPVIRYSGESWQRLPVAEKQYRGDGYLSLCWTIETPAKEVEVAFCYPYGQQQLDALLADTGGFWQADEIGVSGNGCPFFRLSNNCGDKNKRPYGLYLIARQHAMETSGAWVLDGLLRRLGELKCDIPVWAIPFAEPDAILKGDYGKDAFPQDMNRSWGPDVPMRHEVKTIMHDLLQWQERVNENSLIMDFHSPGADEKQVYCHISEEIPETHPIHFQLRELQGALGNLAGEKFIHHARYKPYSAWGNFWGLDEYAMRTLGKTAVSIETSYFQAGSQILEIPNYQHIGKIIADWFIV